LLICTYFRGLVRKNTRENPSFWGIKTLILPKVIKNQVLKPRENPKS